MDINKIKTEKTTTVWLFYQCMIVHTYNLYIYIHT